MKDTSTGPIRCYIGMGSNLGDSIAQLQSAVAAFQQQADIDFLEASSFYRSKPHGPQDQPDYINAVASINSRMPALELLERLLAIETQHGRIRKTGERWGPRTLDLDILLYGQQQIDHPQLTIPHPQLSVRSFVVYPLYELAPELVLPNGQALADYYQTFPGNDLEILPKTNTQVKTRLLGS